MKIDFMHNYIEFEEIDSTNDYLKANYKNLPNYTVVRADFQSKGRGQFDRTWESAKAQNLLISFLFKNELPSALEEDMHLFFVNVIIETLKNYGVDAKIKYPNDVYVKNKKLSGILIEKQFNNDKLEYMVVGIGVNINQEKFENPNAISLKNVIKKNIDLKEFTKQLLTNISKKLNISG